MRQPLYGGVAPGGCRGITFATADAKVTHSPTCSGALRVNARIVAARDGFLACRRAFVARTRARPVPKSRVWPHLSRLVLAFGFCRLFIIAGSDCEHSLLTGGTQRFCHFAACGCALMPPFAVVALPFGRKSHSARSGTRTVSVSYLQFGRAPEVPFLRSVAAATILRTTPCGPSR
jgi:hypothetical protein